MHRIRIFSIRVYQFILANLFIELLALAIIILIYLKHNPTVLPKGKEVESVIAIIVLYTGIVINMINYKIAHDQFFKSLFTEFNNKFDSINDALNAIRKGDSQYKISNVEKTKDQVITDYLNLCAEEYLWFTKGRIEYKVWIAWRRGMDYYLMNKEFKSVVAQCKRERDSYYGLFEELDRPLNTLRELNEISAI